MAQSGAQLRPGRYLGIFLLIIVVLYSLVFFTGSGEPKPQLGIDLQGGTRVTLTARTPDGGQPSKQSLDQARQIIETRVNGTGISGAKVVLDGNNLVITVPGEKGEQAKNLGKTAKLYFRKVVNVGPGGPPTAPSPPKPSAPPGDVEAESVAQIQQAKSLRQNPALENDPALQQQAMAQLDCRPGAQDPLVGNDDPSKPLVACSQNRTDPKPSNTPKKYVLGPSVMDGQQISNAAAGQKQGGAGFNVNLDLKQPGSSQWAQITAQNVGKQIAFALDTEVVSAPSINGAIAGGQTEISGDFSNTEAQKLAETLKYGSLPLSFTSSDATTVSATLGLQSLEAGLLAGGLGLILVFAYCLVYYRLLGLLTILSLALSGIMVYAVLVLIGRWLGLSLDLAGVAGFIIAIGITADSFVILFERLKDEIREGRTFRSAVPRGWPKARRTILASDAVSFLAAAVLYALAVGEVRGFAFTLGLSTVLDLVVVFLVTHPLVAMVTRSKTLSSPTLSGLGGVQRIGAQKRAARKSSGSTTPREA